MPTAGTAAQPSGVPSLRPCQVAAVAALSSGRGVLATGPAGIGKSRALHAVVTSLEATGQPVARVSATTSMAAVPFGALLALGTGWAAGVHDGQWLTRTAAALRATLLDRPGLLLAVDDAHLLDAPSAGVVHQVAVAGVRVLATVRTGLPLPDAVARLVEDAGAQRITIDPLTDLETAALLQGVLGDSIDDRFSAVVHARTGGVPLAAAALGRLAVRTGAVRLVRGRWRLLAELPRSVELGALVSAATDALSPPARRAGELVALAEGLSEPALGALEALVGAEEAERAGVLAISRSGTASVAHPLFADALLAGMPALGRRRRLTELVDAGASDDEAVQAPDVAGQAPRATVDRVRAVGWALDLGRTVPPSVLLELAGLVAAGEPELAERFVRAAVDGGAGVAGSLRLAELLTHQHRAHEAEAVLADLDLTALDEAAALAADLTRAFLLIFVLARPDEGLSRLQRYPAIPVVQALRSGAHNYAGRNDVADPMSLAVATDVHAPVLARAHAALSRASVLATGGRHTELEAWLPLAEHLVEQVTGDIPEGVESLRFLQAFALLRSVDLRACREIATAGYRRALERGDDGDRAHWAHLLCQDSMLRGDAAAAVDLARRASGARGRWTTSLAGWWRGALVASLVLTGDLAEAEREHAELGSLRCQPVVETDVVRWVALLAAAQHDLHRAGRLVEAAARSGAVGAVDAWYDAMRYGRPNAAKAFLRAAEGMTGPGRAAQRAHATAHAARDPAALERAAGDLAAAGLGWYAVDAMAAAVREHARRDPGDGAPGERLRLLAAQHPSLRSPLAGAASHLVLTGREAQVAHLAARGSTSRATAEQLGIGVRTVETHLAHAYRKLGVTTREELRRALGS